MRFSVVFAGALAGLLSLAAPTLRADTPTKPAVILRLKALEELIGDLRYLVKEVGREEEGKQVEAMLKARTGPKGLEGVDVKKPIGLYANLNASLDKSEVYLLLPIADEKTFLAFLDSLNLKAEKGADDLYTMQVENVPVPLLFRFANGYLYGTAKLNPKTTMPGKDALPGPDRILGGAEGILSLTVNVDQIPEAVRKQGVVAASLVLGEAKTRDLPEATEKQKAVRDALLDEAARIVKALLHETTTTQLKLDVDRTANDLSLSFTLDSKPGSTLATDLASLSPSRSVGAGIGGKESVLGGLLHLALPQKVKSVLNPAIDEAIEKALGNMGAQEKELLTPVIDALKPTAKSGVLDVGLEMRGPSKKGKYTLVASLQAEKGVAIEKAVKELLDKLPGDAKAAIETDVAKVGDVQIHRIQQKQVDERARELFGTGPLYLAIREDALLLSMGEDALTAMREAAQSKPTTGQPARMQISAARMALLMAKEQKAAPMAAKKAFTKKGTDQVSLQVKTGERLEVKVSIQTAVLAFASMLDQAKKEKE